MIQKNLFGVIGTDCSLVECFNSNYLILKYAWFGKPSEVLEFFRVTKIDWDRHKVQYMWTWNYDVEGLSFDYMRIKEQIDGFACVNLDPEKHKSWTPYDVLNLSDAMDMWNGYLFQEPYVVTSSPSKLMKKLGMYRQNRVLALDNKTNP